MLKIRLKRVLVTSALLLFLLPFVSLILPVGETPWNQAKLDRIISRVERLEDACDEQKLKGILNYTAYRYRTVGRFGVRIQRLPMAAGLNVPWCPGCIIDSEIWSYPDDIVLTILVHEAHHDYYPWFGHYHFWGTIPAQGYYQETDLERLMRDVP